MVLSHGEQVGGVPTPIESQLGSFCCASWRSLRTACKLRDSPKSQCDWLDSSDLGSLGCETQFRSARAVSLEAGTKHQSNPAPMSKRLAAQPPCKLLAGKSGFECGTRTSGQLCQQPQPLQPHTATKSHRCDKQTHGWLRSQPFMNKCYNHRKLMLEQVCTSHKQPHQTV